MNRQIKRAGRVRIGDQQAPNNSQAQDAIKILSQSPALVVFLQRIEANNRIKEPEIEFFNAAKILTQVAAAEANRKQVLFGHALIDVIQDNSSQKGTGDTAKSRQVAAVVHQIVGRSINTPAGQFSISPNGGLQMGNNAGATHGFSIDGNGKIKLMPNSPKRTKPEPSDKAMAADTGALGHTVQAQFAGKPAAAEQDNIETFHGIPVERAESGFCKASGQKSRGGAGGTRTFNEVADLQFKDRIGKLAAIAKDIDAGVKIHAPAQWDASDLEDPSTVIFEFPAHDTKVFVTRKIGAATLVMKGDARDIEELQNLSYRDTRAPDHVWPLEMPRGGADIWPRFQDDVKTHIVTPKDELKPARKDNVQWQQNKDARTAILKAFAENRDDLTAGFTQAERAQTLGEHLGDNFPSESDLGGAENHAAMSAATLSMLDSHIRTSFTVAHKAEQGGDKQAFIRRGLPREARNLKSAILDTRLNLRAG